MAEIVRFDERAYQRQRTRRAQDIWYGPQRDLFATTEGHQRGRETELIAGNAILPSLGFIDLVDLAVLVRHSPFDFVGTQKGARVVIDVTTKWQKRVDVKARLAAALGFPLFVLMVSPRDQRFFHLTVADPDARVVRVPIASLRSMERFFEERRGR